MLDDVGQRLLDDPVGGALERLRYHRGRVGPGQGHVHTGLAESIGELLQVLETWSNR